MVLIPNAVPQTEGQGQNTNINNGAQNFGFGLTYLAQPTLLWNLENIPKINPSPNNTNESEERHEEADAE